MKPEELVPEIVVKSVQRSLDFYCKVLNFSVVKRVPETGEPTWAEITNGPAKLMLQKWTTTLDEMPKLKKRKKGGITIFVFRLKDSNEINKLSNNISNEIENILTLRNTDYGTVELGISDPDGYIILFQANV